MRQNYYDFYMMAAVFIMVSVILYDKYEAWYNWNRKRMEWIEHRRILGRRNKIALRKEIIIIWREKKATSLKNRERCRGGWGKIDDEGKVRMAEDGIRVKAESGKCRLKAKGRRNRKWIGGRKVEEKERVKKWKKKEAKGGRKKK